VLTDQRALQILEKLLQSGHTLDSLQGEIRISCSEQLALAQSQDGISTDFFGNLSVISLKRDLSIDTTFNPPLFSLVNTFKWI
jgi:hypothetical protein